MRTKIFFFASIILLLTACKKQPNEGIASYIKLLRPTLETQTNQGDTTHSISDLWIEANGTDFGAYEYPAIIPLYLKGKQTITINAGTYKNGDYAERDIYSPLTPFEKSYIFVQKDTTTVQASFKYRNEVNFLYVEDFESSNNFENTERTNANDSENLSKRAGKIALQASDSFQQAISISPYEINVGKRIYLEFSMKTENYGGFGLVAESDSKVKVTLGTFSPFSQWTTFYFDITNFINKAKKGKYHFFIHNDRPDKATAPYTTTYIDNIKILEL